MSTNMKAGRKRWTREETILFLRCYSARKDEFKHSRKKKFAYANVLEDMIRQGLSDTNITTRALEAKMRTLLQAYNNAKDNKKQTGPAHSQAPFMEEMDKILERESIISTSHCLNLGAGIQRPLPESCASVAVEQFSLSNTALSSSGDSFLNAPSRSNTASPSSTFSVSNVASSFSNAASCPHNFASNARKRYSAKEKYYEKKLELQKKFYEDIKNMIAKKLNNP